MNSGHILLRQPRCKEMKTLTYLVLCTWVIKIESSIIMLLSFPQVWSKFNSVSLRLLELKVCKGYGGIKLNIATCLQSWNWSHSARHSVPSICGLEFSVYSACCSYGGYTQLRRLLHLLWCMKWKAFLTLNESRVRFFKSILETTYRTLSKKDEHGL